MEETIYFDPKTGRAKSIPKGQAPPKGWKLVKNPAEIFISYYPHPQYYIDQEGYIHLVFPPKKPQRGWLPLSYEYFTPPEPKKIQTEFEYYWDPKTNLYYMHPDPSNRRLRKITVPFRDGGDLFISYSPPWAAPQLYINPATRQTQWIAFNRNAPKLWQQIFFQQNMPVLSDHDAEELREKRRLMLRRLATDEGVIFTPQGDLANDDDFEANMNALGWQRNPEGEWERIPPRPKPAPYRDPVNNLTTFEKLVYAINRMITHGNFSEDVVEKLKQLLSPEAILIMLALCAIGGPTAIILGGVLLAIGIGMDFYEFCDSLSAVTTSSTQKQLDDASKRLEKAIVGLGIDALLAWLFARSVKKTVTPEPPKPTPPAAQPPTPPPAPAAQPLPVAPKPAEPLPLWRAVFRRMFNVEETPDGIKIEVKPEYKHTEAKPGIEGGYEGNINPADKTLEINYGSETFLNKTGIKGLMTHMIECMIEELIAFARRRGLKKVIIKRVASSESGANMLRRLGFEPIPGKVDPKGIGLWRKVIDVD